MYVCMYVPHLHTTVYSGSMHTAWPFSSAWSLSLHASKQGVRDKAAGKGEGSRNLKVEQKPPVHSLWFAYQWTLTFKDIAISSNW